MTFGGRVVDSEGCFDDALAKDRIDALQEAIVLDLDRQPRTFLARSRISARFSDPPVEEGHAEDPPLRPHGASGPSRGWGSAVSLPIGLGLDLRQVHSSLQETLKPVRFPRSHDDARQELVWGQLACSGRLAPIASHG